MKYQSQNQHQSSVSEQYSEDSYQSGSEPESSQSSQQQQQLIQVQMQRIKEQLKSVPYQLILKQKQALQQNKNPNSKDKNATKKLGKKIRKVIKPNTEKRNKNQALEVSIYQKPKRKQQIIFEQKRRKGKDPRFEQYAGNYNQDLAMKAFNFIPQLQQSEIQQLRSKLKSTSKKHKLTPHQREVLSKEYNTITNDYKRVQLLSLQKQTKNQLKKKHGQDYFVGKKQFKEQFEKKKLENMNQVDREKKMKEKKTQMLRGHLSERRKILNFKKTQ